MAGWFAEYPDATSIRDGEESKSQNSSSWFRGGSTAGYDSRSIGRTLAIALIVLPTEIRGQSGVLPVGMGKIAALLCRRGADGVRWRGSEVEGEFCGAQERPKVGQRAGRATI